MEKYIKEAESYASKWVGYSNLWDMNIQQIFGGDMNNIEEWK